QEARRRYLSGDTELNGSILIRSGDLPDANQPGDASRPAAPDGGSSEDRSRAGTEESIDLSVGCDDAEQPGNVSQPAAPDGGSPEGVRGSAEDRSGAGQEESRYPSTDL